MIVNDTKLLRNCITIPQVPTATTTVDAGIALNKCLWHQNGHQIAAGGDMGKVYIYDVGEVNFPIRPRH